MSYDYDDDQQQNGGALRAQLEEALKKIKALEADNAKLGHSVKTATLSQILADKKVPESVAKWLRKDEVDASPEAVDKWLADNGSDFGYKPGVTETAAEKPSEGQHVATEAPTEPSVPSVLTPEDIAQLERIQGLLAAGTGQTIFSDAAETAVATVESKLGPDADFDSVIAELRAQGIPIESGR